MVKRGDKVKVSNAFGDWYGTVKRILPNPNGPAQVGIMINGQGSDAIYWPIDIVEVLQ